ncbi:O-antigen ligase family protein [Acidovorax sp.]|uniref:O-antigen ligase family protein n=1 Tax=Acidovorax sp. TaxID=1872122 RepID=UPI00391FA08B
MLNLSATLLPAAVTALFLLFPVSLALASILMLVLVLLWLVAGNLRERWLAVQANPVAWGALCLYGLMLLGALYSPARWDEIGLHLTKYLKLPFAVVLMSIISTDKLQQRCLDAFVWAMGFVLACTWLNVWWDLPWSKTHNQGWNVTHHVFGDYITQNIMMAFMVLVALVRMLHASMPWRRAGWAVVSILAGVSITHLSEGRTGYLLLCIVLVVFVFSALRGRNRWIAAILGACLTAGILVSSDLVRERVLLAYTEVQRSGQEQATSVGNRMYLYQITPELIAEKPLIGHGTGAYHSEICRFVDIPQGCHGWINWHPHNQYLYFAADHGLLGFAAYVFMLLSMVWLARRAASPETRVLLIGLAALLAVNSMTNSPLWSARESHFFTYMMALLSCRILARPAVGHNPARPHHGADS